MAENDTSLNAVGPAAAQLKTKLSALEKTQINSARNLGGGVSGDAGVINGDVSKKLTQINSHQRSMMELSADISSKMEKAGAIQKTSEQALRPGIVSTVQEKNRLHERFTTTPTDLRIAGNRNPSIFKKSPQEKIQSKKDEAFGPEDFAYGGITWPSDLKQNASAYVELWFQKYNRSDAFSKGSVAPSIKIWFPIPENLSIGYNIKYQERDTGILGDVVNSSKGREAIKSVTSGNFAALEDIVSNTSGAEAANALQQVSQRAAFAALNSASETVGGLAEQITGTIPNPHPTVFFKGVDLREFTWTWKFVPRSAAEAQMLQIALANIRKLILPEASGGFLNYPYLLKPAVKSDGSDMLIYGKFKKSAVKQFLINYTAEGTSAFFHDGNPVAINCQMTFQEVEIYTADDA